jgi:hypothetical protein
MHRATQESATAGFAESTSFINLSSCHYSLYHHLTGSQVTYCIQLVWLTALSYMLLIMQRQPQLQTRTICWVMPAS